MIGAALQSCRAASEVLPSAADAYATERRVCAHPGQLLRGNAEAFCVAGEATGVTTAAFAFVY
jgi:hypothetical protein